jgi:periplasmic divalent cation tolerance protein
METPDFVTVQTTTDTAAEAEKLASAAVEQQLAACVQISEIRSYYRWEGETHHDPEFLLTLKTTAASVPGIKKLLLREHSFDEPELIVQPIIAGGDSYLQWIADSTAAE